AAAAAQEAGATGARAACTAYAACRPVLRSLRGVEVRQARSPEAAEPVVPGGRQEGAAAERDPRRCDRRRDARAAVGGGHRRQAAEQLYEELKGKNGSVAYDAYMGDQVMQQLLQG